MMPKIERSVAYTFDAYSGGMIEDIEGSKTCQSSVQDCQVLMKLQFSNIFIMTIKIMSLM